MRTLHINCKVYDWVQKSNSEAENVFIYRDLGL